VRQVGQSVAVATTGGGSGGGGGGGRGVVVGMKNLSRGRSA
jgi:hypothetical protein